MIQIVKIIANRIALIVIWPTPIAPFQLALLPMNMHKSQRLREVAEALECSEGVARNMLFRSVRKLRAAVAAE